MKWQLDDCRYGDVVRVKDGAIYHYGIFVSADEVIAFGRVPSYYLTVGRGEKIVVLSTSASEFANGNFIERGVVERDEKKLLRSPDEIVSRAKSRLGEEGYNIIHNNCEHFVNECALGIKRSLHEEELRRRWNSRPKTDVYICLDQSVPHARYTPVEREKSLKGISNESVLREKRLSWDLLDFAIKQSFDFDTKEICFKEQRNGKWTCDKLHFSMTHSQGAVAVAVSNSPCGVDMENINAFLQKCTDEAFAQAFCKKIGCNSTDSTDLLKCWTAKECVYKASGEGSFSPRNTDVANSGVRYIQVGDYIVAFVCKNEGAINCYLVENGKKRLMLEGDYKCI